MSYADYEHCPGCDAKTIYMGDREPMRDDVVTWHAGCLRDALGKQTVRMLLADGRKVAAVPWSAVDDLIGADDGRREDR